jgi:uncharacterized protein (TIGR02266 family)
MTKITETIDNENRRNSSRLEATFQVKYKTLDSLVSAYTENISKGGIYIKTDSMLPLNSMVKIKLAMPDEGPEIECIGQVARAHKKSVENKIPSGMAVVFRDMSDEHYKFIEDYISQLSKNISKKTESEKISSQHILIVDDDSTVRKNAKAVLEKQGHKVVTAEDGLKGLAQCLKNPPDIILSDVQMPKMDGWNFLKTIRARTSLAPTLFIFQTSLKNEKDRLKGYQMGVDDYLAKPYSSKDLISRINKLVTRTKQNQSMQPRSKALRGDIEQVSISTLLSLLEMEKKTGVLMVVSNTLCRIYIKNGRPLSIEMENDQVMSQMDMITDVLHWESGQFEFAVTDVPSVDKIKNSMQGMLMESARLKDETGVVKLP